MGSSGSGRFSDYSGSPKQTENTGGSSGGSSGHDRCRQAFAAGLEDVEQYDYYNNHGHAIPVGTRLILSVVVRVIALTETGESVGALPTSFNYIAGCLNSGITYTGIVTNSSSWPIMRVDVDFAAD